jgi:hypothetical protein
VRQGRTPTLLVSDAIDFRFYSEFVETGEKEAEKEADPTV